jgi:diguanylate cyclase (GGDEF)-like protein
LLRQKQVQALSLENRRLRGRVKALEHFNQELLGQALHDPLTGLLNKRGFTANYERTLSAAIRHGRRFTLAILDLDFFKKVNDTHGHAAGDFVLQEVAKIVKGALRLTDTVSRWGGEEIAVILEETSFAQAAIPLERIRQQVEEHVFLRAGTAIKLTASIGYAAYEPDKLRFKMDRDGRQALSETLFEKADLALYYSKNGGRNQISGQE